MLSFTEENYLKALLNLTLEESNRTNAGTNELALHLGVKPATANDMLKKLKEKKLIHYEKYGKSSLTVLGKKLAIGVIRRHRLWETFLFQKLEFTWDEVHELAEQLEHIQSQKLVDKLDQFLDFPGFDPHGDVIPNAKGEMKFLVKKTLAEELVGHHCTMIGVKDNSAPFLQYVDSLGMAINTPITILAKHPFDDVLDIEVKRKKLSVGPRFAENILIVCNTCSKPKTTPKK